MENLMTIKEASIWASEYLGKDITSSNISYLVQYGRIPKRGNNGSTLIHKNDLEIYYREHSDTKENIWKKKLGDDLNWNLSFSQYKETETTKHVHRLHPYKGKFIPQLAAYFLDEHTDDVKRKCYFHPDDIILDPFCGSGTTLVQASELNLHALGVDVSAFNAFISNTKITRYDIAELEDSVRLITEKLNIFQKKNNADNFENALLEALRAFNNQFFPSPEYKYKVRQGKINEKEYGRQKAAEFLNTYHRLVDEYNVQLGLGDGQSFLDTWFLKLVRNEIDFTFAQIKRINNPKTRKILALILSRTIRSCRATTHADLGTLKEPVTTSYYCKKHGKICKPLFTIVGWWQRYTQDTIKRLQEFELLRGTTEQYCLTGDSRSINIVAELKKKRHPLADLIKRNKFNGIFSSPPYVGLIDYHEQHAYAYDLLGYQRNDQLEIGPLCKGQGMDARKSYIKGISDVLNHCKQWLIEDYNVFLVANDKYNLYPAIAENAGMKVVQQYKRPVLNRVEKDSSAYAEIIFHLREK